MFELEKKREKLGKPQIIAMKRKLSGKKYWVRIFIPSAR